MYYPSSDIEGAPSQNPKSPSKPSCVTRLPPIPFIVGWTFSVENTSLDMPFVFPRSQKQYKNYSNTHRHADFFSDPFFCVVSPEIKDQGRGQNRPPVQRKPLLRRPPRYH